MNEDNQEKLIAKALLNIGASFIRVYAEIASDLDRYKMLRSAYREANDLEKEADEL